MEECRVSLLPILETETQEKLTRLLQHTICRSSSTDQTVRGVAFARVSEFLAHVCRTVTFLDGKVLSGLAPSNFDASAEHDERFV